MTRTQATRFWRSPHIERQQVEAARLILASAAPEDTGLAVVWAKRILEKQERTNDE